MKLAAGTEPNMTELASVKSLPRILTFCPPAPGPLLLVTEVTAAPTAVHVKLVDAWNPALSVTVTVTAKTPGVQGGTGDRPGGGGDGQTRRADRWPTRSGVATLEESVADSVTGMIETPTRLVWVPGPVTDTVSTTDQVNEAESLDEALSVTVTVTG